MDDYIKAAVAALRNPLDVFNEPGEVTGEVFGAMLDYDTYEDWIKTEKGHLSIYILLVGHACEDN